ncbi:MAG: hypothetical protein OEW37_00025 [Rhodospirillaceae bacterium]|nr:hypothetical protein [Rhodospirillaceae bacterium]
MNKHLKEIVYILAVVASLGQGEYRIETADDIYITALKTMSAAYESNSDPELMQTVSECLNELFKR